MRLPVVSENLESWLEWREAAERLVPGYVEENLRGCLACGLLCVGFARAVCTTRRTGFVVAARQGLVTPDGGENGGASAFPHPYGRGGRRPGNPRPALSHK